MSTRLADAVAVLEALPGRADPAVEVFSVTRALAVRRVLLGGDLPQAFLDRALAHAADLVDRPARAYAPAAELSRGELMHAGVAGRLAALQDEVATGDVALHEPSGEPLRMLVTRLVPADGPGVTLYRELRSSARLDRSKVAALVWRSGRYDRLETEDVLVVDDRFDAVVVGGTALFTSKAAFERLFDFTAELRRTAGRTFDEVTCGLGIDGAEALREACLRDPGMLAKLASVRRHLDTDPGYRAAISPDRLAAYVREHPETGVELTASGALCFPADRRRRFAILKLLDDDYLHSPLTDRSYEVNSKAVLGSTP